MSMFLRGASIAVATVLATSLAPVSSNAAIVFSENFEGATHSALPFVQGSVPGWTLTPGTGADAVMIGRAAQGRPWIFRDTEHFLEHGTLPAAPTTREVAALMVAHLQDHYALYGNDSGVRSARKHIGWYTDGLPDSESFRDDLNRLTDADAQLAAVLLYFARLADSHDALPLPPYPAADNNTLH